MLVAESLLYSFVGVKTINDVGGSEIGGTITIDAVVGASTTIVVAIPFPWEISFRFAASRNEVDIVIGDLPEIDKLGWDYLWVQYADAEDEDASELIKKPIAVYVEKVYLKTDFETLGIGV